MNGDPYQAPGPDAVRSTVSAAQFVAALVLLAAIQAMAVGIGFGVAQMTGGPGEPLCSALPGLVAGAAVWRFGVRRRLGDAWGATLLCLLAFGVLVVLVTIPTVAKPVADGTVNLLQIGVALVFGGFATVVGVVGWDTVRAVYSRSSQ